MCAKSTHEIREKLQMCIISRSVNAISGISLNLNSLRMTLNISTNVTEAGYDIIWSTSYSDIFRYKYQPVLDNENHKFNSVQSISKVVHVWQ